MKPIIIHIPDHCVKGYDIQEEFEDALKRVNIPGKIEIHTDRKLHKSGHWIHDFGVCCSNHNSHNDKVTIPNGRYHYERFIGHRKFKRQSVPNPSKKDPHIRLRIHFNSVKPKEVLARWSVRNSDRKISIIYGASVSIQSTSKQELSNPNTKAKIICRLSLAVYGLPDDPKSRRCGSSKTIYATFSDDLTHFVHKGEKVEAVNADEVVAALANSINA